MRWALALLVLAGCSEWRVLNVDDPVRRGTHWIGCGASSVVLGGEHRVHVFDGWRVRHSPRRDETFEWGGYVAPTGEVFVLTQDRSAVLRFGADGWRRFELEPRPDEVYAVGGSSARHVYVSARHTIYALEGERFVPYSSGTYRPMHFLFADGAGALWAGSRDGTVRVHRDGAWQDRSPPSAALTGLAGSASDDVWVTGEREIFHWDGREWSERTPPDAEWIRAPVAGEAGELYVSIDAALHRWAGSESHPVDAPREGFSANGVCLTDTDVVVYESTVFLRERTR